MLFFFVLVDRHSVCSRASISTLSLVFTFCCILHAPELFTGIKALFYFFLPPSGHSLHLAHNKYSIFIVVGTFIYSEIPFLM